MGVCQVLKELATELQIDLYRLEGRPHPDFVSEGCAIVFDLSGGDRKNFTVARVPTSSNTGTVSDELRAAIRDFALTKVRV
jgi:hypothetical protein